MPDPGSKLVKMDCETQNVQIVVFRGSENAKVCLQDDDDILYRVYKTVMKMKRMVLRARSIMEAARWK